MHVRLTYHEVRPDHPVVGDCWPAPWLVEGDAPREFFLSSDFIARWIRGEQDRYPLIVRIPGAGGGEEGAFDFCIDGPVYTRGQRDGGGWQVTVRGPLTDGGNPDITVHPSINVGGGWHGWIRAGILVNA